MGIFSNYLMSKNRGAPREKPTPKSRPKQIINTNEIRKVTFQKGDILVIRYANALSVEAKINIEKTCKAVLEKVGLKDDVGIMVLEQGLDISAVLTQRDYDSNRKEKNGIDITSFDSKWGKGSDYLPTPDPDLSDFQRSG